MTSREHWRRGLELAVIAVGLIALGALAPRLVSSHPTTPRALTSPSQITGTLICLDCELLKRKPRPGLEASLLRRGRDLAPVADDRGRLVLRDDSGEVWVIVPRRPEDAEALATHSLAGRRATVFGIPEPRLHAIDAHRLGLD